ncbi:MAG: N-acetylneuraminate synthase [Lentisphaerota bacterium]
MKTISIAGRLVGPGQPCFVIAEAGVNHNGSTKTALALVDAAAAAGADAVKFQTFKTETLVTRTAPKAEYQKSSGAAHETQFDMLKKLELSEKAHRIIAKHCRKKKILFLSTPFDETCADFLDTLGVPAFKIGSGDLTNLPLLSRVARMKKPVILSTGMSSWKQVDQAVALLGRMGLRDLVLLHCVSEYPADPATVNLKVMNRLARRYKVPAGFSDHTQGLEAALAAVALGACVIEKHFTLDCSLPGPDHKASMEPDELTALVRGVRKVEAMLGTARKRLVGHEWEIAAVARKSLVSTRALRKGSVLRAGDIAIRRPGTGLEPSLKDRLIGKRTTRNMAEGELFTRDILKAGKDRTAWMKEADS